MFLEHVIELPCEPKRRFGSEGLRTRMRHLNRLQDDLPITDDEATEAVEAAFQLRPLAFHCTRCPANHARREFGCVEWVPLPLSEDAERWLMERLPLRLRLDARSKSTTRAQVAAVRALLRRLRELGVRGAVLDARRRPPEGSPPAAERPAGIVRTYGFFRRERISSSQLLELLMLHERIEPEAAELVCRALELWIDGEVGSDGTPEAVFTQPPGPRDDPSLAALKRFFHALIVACSLGVGVGTGLME